MSFSNIVLTLCDVIVFALWLGVVLVAGGRNIVGASLHPPAWLVRCFSGKQLFK
jgi:hypothetical protein